MPLYADSASYPRHLFVLGLGTPVATSGTWTATLSTTGTILGGYRGSDGVQNRSISYDLILSAGTWTFDFFHRADVACGIYSITIDGVTPTSLSGSADNFDGYNAAATATQSSITGIVIPSNSIKRVTLTMATKNALGATYTGKICGISASKVA